MPIHPDPTAAIAASPSASGSWSARRRGAEPRPRTPAVAVPNFWNPRSRGERVEAPQTGRAVRFLTDDEFPPLHFAGPDGNPTGFVVELARAVCEKLSITCTVQARRFDTLLDALDEQQGDVVAAAIPLTATLREKFLATRPYFRWPARFAAADRQGPAGSLGGGARRPQRRGDRRQRPRGLPEGVLPEGRPEGLHRSRGGRGRAASAARSTTSSPTASTSPSRSAARMPEKCCALIGGDYLENRYFGEGIGLVTRQEDAALSRALDDALQRVWDDGKYTELYLRFFPVGPF